VLQLDPPARTGLTPSGEAGRQEDEAWVRLGMELLEPEQRDLVVQRQWEGRTYAEIGEALGISENAARLRYVRVLKDLSDTIAALRRGDIDAALRAAGEAGSP
jgi:DNA-directed RNA polymerase specialized sigma24 family protein